MGTIIASTIWSVKITSCNEKILRTLYIVPSYIL